MTRLLAAALACLLPWACCAGANARVLLESGTPAVLDLTPATAVLEDVDRALDLAAVRAPPLADAFRALSPGETTFGYARDAYWFRFEVENTLPGPVRRAVVIDYALLDDVALYRVEADGSSSVRRGGDRTPFHTRDLDDRHLNFVVDFAPHERSTFYLRVASQSSMQVPLRLVDPREYLTGSSARSSRSGCTTASCSRCRCTTCCCSPRCATSISSGTRCMAPATA
jgi:hypothetical protein